jgi:hypothetical protein
MTSNVLRGLVASVALVVGAATPLGAAADRVVVDDVGIRPADFTEPTTIDHPLAPLSQVRHAISLGVDEGEPLRIETVLLPDTKTIRWKGGTTEVIVSQYLALVDGDVVEVTYDWFAQDDEGNVWYFGEDVVNYKDGKPANDHGSWIAGKDGPPGMLMPADPQVGDVFHPENIPGLVYEEDRVLSTTETVDGPQGPIENVLEVREELKDGTVERKYWAPGYGELRALTPGEEDVRIEFAIPNDIQPGPSPDPLVDLQHGVVEAFELARAGDTEELGDAAIRLFEMWRAYGANEQTIVVDEFVKEVDDALAALARVVAERDTEAAAAAAIELELAVLDVMTTHDGPPDGLRIDALARRQELEAERGDKAAVASTKAYRAVLEERLHATEALLT